MSAHGETGNGHGPDLPVAGGPMQTDVPAFRLIATLAIAGALAGLLIVSVFQWAQPRILAHQALVLGQAIEEVLSDPARYDTLYVAGDALTKQPPAGTDPASLDKVYLGFDDDGAPVGFAVQWAEPGFQDVITLLFGYDAANNRLLGMTVMEAKETPGLGDKIIKDTAFVNGFSGPTTPIVGVKVGAGTGAPEEVDMITGATISSRAVIKIINDRLEQIGPLLRAYHPGGGS
ncbi:MAG: FMN-binding protein [Gemmatimonadota bacterium]|jgi:electron transport complex protein RnfG